MATQVITKPVFGASGHDTKRNVPYFNSVVLDFAGTNLNGNHTSTDVFSAISVPANSCVCACGIDILTVDTGGVTLALSSSAPATTYVEAGATTSAGQMALSLNAVGEMWSYFDAADTLDMTLAVAVATTLKVRVWALILDYTDPIEEQRVTFA